MKEKGKKSLDWNPVTIQEGLWFGGNHMGIEEGVKPHSQVGKGEGGGGGMSGEGHFPSPMYYKKEEKSTLRSRQRAGYSQCQRRRLQQDITTFERKCNPTISILGNHKTVTKGGGR